MGLESEVELLKRKNRWLKVALFTITTVLLLAVSIVGVAATRARAMSHQAREHEIQARAEAERAVRIAEVAREQAENKNHGEP
jgi:hypothetical protein